MSAEISPHAHYNDRVARQFAVMTVVWGIVGMAVGVLDWCTLRCCLPR